LAKYLVMGSYTTEGARGLLAEGGTARRAATEKLAASMGGRLEAYYFTFGSDDFCAIFEAPDNVSIAAGSLVAAASGAIRSRVIPLLTPEEIDEAARKTPAYRAPGA
jgi:uncharacterized protein with GYD domain